MEINSKNYNINPTFTAYKSTFSKKLESALDCKKISSDMEKKLLCDFADMYDKKINLNTKIGSGFYGTVYKIDDSYVLKRGNEYLEPELKGIKLFQKRKFIQLKHYFGEAVAKIFNNNGEDMLILKNVYSKGKSIPVGIPDEYTHTHTPEECVKYYNEVYLPKFAKLPQRSFDGIAKDFALLNKMCTKRMSYFFDYLNPNNFVLTGKTLRILDDINEDNMITKNCVTDMFDVFLNRMDLEHNAEYNKDAVKLRKILIKKLILAGVKHNVPICQVSVDLPVWETTFNKLLGYQMTEADMKNSIKKIDQLTEQNKNPKKRVELVKQYLEDVIGL